MVRLLMKWLHAGVMEDGELHEVEEGTPQGGIISPLLANIYLHYVLDLWVCQWRKRHARGEVYIVRYADDFVMGFQNEQDARAMRAALAERLAKFGLELHPDKTRVMRVRAIRPTRTARRRGLGKPETFDFLGFTHIAGTSRRGAFQLQAPHLTEEAAGEAGAACKERMREATARAGASSNTPGCASVLDGHYRYYGVPTNYRALRQLPPSASSAMWHRAASTTEPTRAMDRRAAARRSSSASRFRVPASIIPGPTERFAAR